MVFGCNWPNCSKEFGDQKQYNDHLMREHLGEQQQKAAADGIGTMNDQTTMMISKIDDKKRIFLPVETWVDILLCISRIELAQSVSLTNCLFNAISRPRMDEHNKRIVPPLLFKCQYQHALIKLERSSSVHVEIPIAQVPPPINILGFKRLCFWYINNKVLEFLRLTKPILGENVCLGGVWYSDMMPYFHLFCSIIKGNVSELFTFIDNFNLLNMEFLETIQFVRIYGRKKGKGLLAVDEQQRVLEWMHSPLDGNRTRYIFMKRKCDCNKLAETCKKRFLESTVPISFMFHFNDTSFLNGGRTPTFSIENNQTGEQLTLGWYYDEGKSYFMLCRSKIGDDLGWREVIRKMNIEDENRTELMIDIR